MSTISGDLRSVTARLFASPEPHSAEVRSTVRIITQYYKMAAYDSGYGFREWINLTGDNTGQPTAIGTYGTTKVIAKWTV